MYETHFPQTAISLLLPVRNRHFKGQQRKGVCGMCEKNLVKLCDWNISENGFPVTVENIYSVCNLRLFQNVF